MISFNNHFTLTPLIYRLAYTLLYYLLTPLLFLRLLLKHQKSNEYKGERQSLRLLERLGIFTPPPFNEAPIWIHTVSVGEFLATLPLIKQLMQEFPQYPIVITCTTTTGSAQILKTFTQEIEQGKLFHVYLPYDLPGSMTRFLKKIRPCLALVMETEIWPNLLHISQQLEIPIWLLNARMSAKSAKGYARFASLSNSALQKFTGIAAQDVLDAGRLKELGAHGDTLHVTGSIKFDLVPSNKDITAGIELRQQLNWQQQKVLIAASTHKGEDEILLEVFQQLKMQHPNLVMIIVPRHPERFQSVYQLCVDSQNTHTHYNVVKRSQLNGEAQQSPDILIGDSMGEMMRYFSCSDLVFMGGTMVATGGHNILEPAALGLPVVYGPYIFNFHAINELFQQYQASLQVADVNELKESLNTLLSDEQSALQMGEKAKQLIMQNSGALNKLMGLISPYLSSETK